jgi:hypothetical protein
MSARFRKLCAFDEQIAPGLGCAIMVIVVLVGSATVVCLLH